MEAGFQYAILMYLVLQADFWFYYYQEAIILHIDMNNLLGKFRQILPIVQYLVGMEKVVL
jgi:hypothetical protein